jgi:hypothetical protein
MDAKSSKSYKEQTSILLKYFWINRPKGTAVMKIANTPNMNK